MTTTQIGFIGAGHIGAPMVKRLLDAGHAVTVYARRDEVRERLAADGATIAQTTDELVVLPVVITCLFTETQVLELCTPIVAGMAPGSVFVSHTTGGPGYLRALGETGAEHGVGVVEAPFSGTPEDVANGVLTVLLAGDDAAVDLAEPVVSAYAAAPMRTGALGTAAAAKLLNNALFGAFTQLLLGAMEAGESLGIDQHTLLDVLSVSSSASTAGRYIAESGADARGYIDRIRRYMQKDVEAVRSVAAELDVDISDLLAAAERGPMDITPEPVG